MDEFWKFILIFAGWFVLMKFILPKLGVPT